MEALRIGNVDIDIRKHSLVSTPSFVQNDSNVIRVSIYDNGEPADLSNIGKVVVNYKRPDRQIFSRELTRSNNVVDYKIGLPEMEKVGVAQVELQLYDLSGSTRLSLFRFSVNIVDEIGTQEVREDNDDVTLLQEIFMEVEDIRDYSLTQAEAAKKAAESAVTNWKQPVANKAAVDALPSPKLGDTVQTNDNGYVYRYDGKAWVKTQEYGATALANVNALLADKASKSEVRKINVPIGLNDADSELLAAIQNKERETTFNLLSVPRNGTVSYEKTNFIKIGKNLFNKNNITPSYRVDPNTGNISPQIPEYPVSVSEYIPVKPSTQYTLKRGGEVAFYNENLVFISGLSRRGSFTTPSNAYYVRHNTDGQSIADQQLEIGVSSTTFEPYVEYAETIQIKKQNVKGRIIEKDNLDFEVPELKVGKNLFNKLEAVDGKYVDSSSGNLANEIPPYYYWASGYISVTPGEAYVISTTSQQHAWYDENKVFISGGNSKVLNAPQGAKYLRVSVPEASVDTFQVEKGTASTPYVSFGYTIDYLMIPNKEKSQIYVNQDSPVYLTSSGSFQIAWKRLLKNYNPNTMRVSILTAPTGTKLKSDSIELNNVPEGTRTLTFKVEYLSGEEITTQQLTIQSSSKTVKTTQQYVLMIGDSLTREPGFTSTVTSELTNVSSVGIRSMNDDGAEVNEGRGGWKLSRYATEQVDTGSVENPFMFPNGVSGSLYFGNTESWKKICYGEPNGYEYKGFQLIAKDWIVGGDYKYGADGYRLNPPTGAVMYDPTKSTGQKFRQYDGSTWIPMAAQPNGFSFDFGKYLERFKVAFGNGLKNPTIISIMLSTNDLQNIRKADSSTMLTLRGYLTTMLNSIKAWNPNVKIILCVPPLSSTQDRWGDARGIDMTKWEFDDNIHLFARELTSNASLYPMSYSVCNMIGAQPDEIMDYADWLHPTSQGRVKLGKLLAGAVQFVRTP